MKLFNEATGRFMDAGSDEEYDYETHQSGDSEEVEFVSEVGHVNPPGRLTQQQLNARLNAYFSDPKNGLRLLGWKEQIRASINADVRQQQARNRRKAQTGITEFDF